MEYKPDYDTTIRTTTEIHRHNTWHRDGIDWSYPFDDPEHTACMCCNEEGKRNDIARRKEWLRLCEAGGEVRASTYGGWPRIWHRVLNVGMASCWPYWKPRPVVMVEGTSWGVEYYDWRSLTGVEVRNTHAAKEAGGGDE